MLPSDSDDEAPFGGYYIVEGNPRPEPPADMPTLPPPQPARSRSPIPVEPSLLPKKPIRPPPKKVIEDMEPSDSDDEPPSGGYQIREAQWQSNRDRLLGRSGPGQQSGGVTGAGVSRRNSMPTKQTKGFRIRRPSTDAKDKEKEKDGH